MYSMVLVMALAGSAEVPDCHWNCGCFGSSYGCYGRCYGGCYGGYYAGCYGGYRGGCYGGNYSGTVVYSGCSGYYQGRPAGYTVPPAGEKVGEPKKNYDQTSAAAPARIVVTLPPNAKLMIDDYASSQTSTQRVLVTPPIPPGQEFSYTLVAEVTQDGQQVRQSQRVTVRPGQEMPVRFNLTSVPATAAR
jgi:uncharacterized protein (TIGR03000 family)